MISKAECKATRSLKRVDLWIKKLAIHRDGGQTNIILDYGSLYSYAQAIVKDQFINTLKTSEEEAAVILTNFCRSMHITENQ
jgi:hypothetical protein